MEFILILLLAFLLDLLLSDPPNTFHPVAWMGKVISLLEKAGHHLNPFCQFLYGGSITIFTITLFTLPTWLVMDYLANTNSVVFIILGGIILKLTFSFTYLKRTALKIKDKIDAQKLDDARFELRALVSRDTSKLSKPKLVSATVESVAESSGDSIISPLFFYLLFGVPGAVAFRAVNTLDSMIGYRGSYEYLGKFASRLDDVLNFIPARIAAILLILAAFIKRRGTSRAWHTLLRDKGLTDSPNAGWPMATIAGALGVELEKEDQYKLGQNFEKLDTAKIVQTIEMVSIALISWMVISLIIGVIYIVC